MITVVFSTFNGSQTLPIMLESLTNLAAPHGGWKIIAVDNASTDDSSRIINDYRNRLPLTLLHQPKQGKNFALNYAIPHCEGDLLVFTDDDIIAPTDWLLSYERLAQEERDYAIFGGKIIPHWPDNKPEAIVKAIPQGPAYAVHKEHMCSGPIMPSMVWGPNMAIRSTLFEAGLRFNESIGPSVGNYIMGSETELTSRLAEAGYLCWFEASLAVKHQIRPEQLSPKWLAGRARRFGRHAAHNEHLHNGSPKVSFIMGHCLKVGP
jgi:glycosyltransferase involved in cell wall biosynthesis